MLKFLKRNIGPIVAFFTTILLTLFIFYEVGILTGTILISDLNAEYQPLLIQLRRILTGEYGLFNFNTGMGDDFIGTFYYYISSPFNILSLFIKDINLLVIILVTIKLALSSVFSYLFFRYQFKQEKIKYLLIFSLLYSLSSFSLSYYLHIMWLDIYMLFPLLLLGIDKIIKEKKHLIYIISLILIIFCNYYFAYMVCIFSFIYYNYKLIINKIDKKKLVKDNIHFIIVTVLSILGASIVLLPIASEIKTYSRQNGMLFGGEDINISFNFINIIKNYILGNVDNIDLLNEHNFYIYTSIIVIPLLYFYFINKKITLREKILSACMLSLLILSISCNYINYIWHGFVPPSFFNGRYTFMFILFVLLISCKSLYYFEEFKLYHFVIIASIILLPITFLFKFTNSLSLNTIDIISLGVFAIYIITLKLIHYNKYVASILLATILYETNINAYTYLHRYNFDVASKNDSHEIAINYIKENDDNLFYRIEDNVDNTDNYSILYNYYSIDYFMSTVKKDLINFFINLDVGDHSYTKNTISYDGSFHLISSLLNVKYYIDTRNIENDIYDKMYTTDDNYVIYKNQYNLGLGYMVNNNILNNKLDSNGLYNINSVYKDMTDIDILKEIKIDKLNDNNYTFKNTKKNNFFVLIKLKNWYSYSDLEVYINDELLENNNNTYNYYVINNYEQNKDINIDISANSGTIEDIEGIYVYYLDNDKFEKSISKLRENELKITKISNDKIEGIVTVDDNDILFTSIPDNKNLYVYVDGKKANKLKVLNTFVGVKLDKGAHEITIKYIPKTLYLSLIPSTISLFVLALYLNIYKKRLAKN